MTGSFLNAAGILLGALAGLVLRPNLSRSTQNYIRLALGGFTLAAGGRLVWESIGGTAGQGLKQFGIAFLALILGRLIGRMLRLQKFSNRLGESARAQIARVTAGQPPKWSEGFNVCAALFCAAPLAVLGAATDGLTGNFLPLGIKAVMDGMAAMSFVAMFGGSVALAALPVFVWQGTLTLLCAWLSGPLLAHAGLAESLNVVAGLLMIYVAVVIFEIRKVELADYLPALAVAPLLTWLWR